MCVVSFRFWLSNIKPFSGAIKMSPNSRHFHSNFAVSSTVSQELPMVERFGMLLEICPDIASLKRVHAFLFTSGLGGNIFLGSKLLNGYASFGCVAESARVFEKITDRDPSLWNSIFVGYFRSCRYSEVLRLYSNLKRNGAGIDTAALTFSLKSIIQLGTLEFGWAIHADSFKFSLNNDGFVGSSLLGFYSKFCIEDAHLAFEDIIEKDVVAYTAMITGYAQNGHAWEALRAACCMQKEGLEPNRVTLVSLLRAAAQLEAIKEGQSIHCYAIRRGIGHFDEILETSLVDMYIKCGAPNIASSIFCQTEIRTIATWNAMIAGFVQLGQAAKALELLRLMLQEHLAPDSITIANALLGCADLKSLLQGTSIHGYIIRMDVNLDLVTVTALIDMYSKCEKIHKAKKLFDRMKTRDIISFNVLIAGYLQRGLADAAIEIFCGMVEAGVRPNAATILSILSAAADLTDIKKGRSIHGCVVRCGLESNMQVANQILHMYGRCGCIEITRKMFNRMKEKDLASWTSMMMSYIYHGHADEVLVLFSLMRGAGEEPDSVTLVSLLQALSQLGCLQQVMEVHGYVHRVGLWKDATVINSLVTTYSKCGRLDIAEVLFKCMKQRDLTSWNTMIAVYGMHGNCMEALKLFSQMQEQNVMPDEVTFTSILSACSHVGLVEKGQQIFHSMTSERLITPGKEHYACMVDLFGRAGRLEEAYDLVRCLPPRDSTSALRALLAACRVHKNTELGEVTGKQLLDLEPESSGAYTLVSNMYAETCAWNEVERIRALSKARGLRKMPGYSLIEVDK